MRSLLIGAFLLVAFIGIGGSQAQQCTTVCPRSLPTTVVPKVESTYVYSLETKTLLTPRDTQKVTIKADVEVAIQSVCESSLKLTNVVIEGVPDAPVLATQLQVNPIKFGYFNGRVRGVCPTKDEEEWVVNIKKAVVSALQVSVTGELPKSEEEELDFSGKCLTVFKTSKSGDSVVIEKSKDLNKCHDRRVDLRQTPDQALGQFKELIRQYLHPVDSQSNCKITLSEQVVKNVECEETHHLFYRRDKPLHQSNLKLSLKNTKTGVAADFANREYQLQDIFLTSAHKPKTLPTEADVVAVLKDLCTSVSGDTANIESSTQFAKLTNYLKYLNDDVATSVDEAVKSGSVCTTAPKRLRELFLDASAFAASDSAIKTLVKAHNNKELTVSRAAAQFTVVALKAAPNEDTVRALLPLIQSETTTRPLLLGFSVLIRRYCEKTKNCETNAAIQEARDAYVSRIGATTDKLTKVTLLQGLENLNVNRNSNENVVKLLDEIINSQEAGDAARLAAVKALPDDASLNEQLKGIVLKETNPNEVRVAAFQKLVNNKGVTDVAPFVAAENHCVKNYVLGVLKNLKKSKNPVRRSLVPETFDLPEEPSNAIGITKNLQYEYGPVAVDLDVVYPETNVTRSIGARVSRVSDGKVVQVVEILVRQEGFDKQLGNVLNLIARKVTPGQFGFEVVKHLSEIIAKLKKKDHEHNHLQVFVRVNGKNVVFVDAFEDLHTLVELMRNRIQQILSDKKVDHTIGGVLIDTKVVVPTVAGIPLVYKLNDNSVIQINGEAEKTNNRRHFILNRSLVSGIQASLKLKLKDHKMGYEYDGKVAVTPNIDVEVEPKEKGALVQLNMKQDRLTLLKFKQSLKEVKNTGVVVDSENELAPEPRSDECLHALILNYCRKASQVKGLKLPNVEYYVTKPEAEITALQLEVSGESPTPSSKKVQVKLNALGSKSNREHLFELDVAYPKDGAKEMKLILKSPENSFETKFSLNLDQSRNLNVKLNLPHVIDINLKGNFEREKEVNGMKSDIVVDYKFPEDPTTHTLKYKNALAYNFKRTSKDKVANFDYSSQLESTRRPFLNHRTLVAIKYRPYKLNEVTLEFAYGQAMDNLYKFSRVSNVDVQEFRPFKMNSNSEINIVATDFDVNYELKSDNRILNDKGNAFEFDLNVKGKDRSKRAAEGGNNDIDGKIQYRNKGSSIDSKLDASLNVRGRELAWNSELKQVEPQKYEGKITIQTDKDKKIFIVHKETVSKPTKEIHLQSEADISYSYKPDKRTYKLLAKKQSNQYLLNGEATQDGKVIFSNDVSFDSSNGNLKAKLAREARSYDLNVDNLLRPREATLLFKNQDREYNIKMNRDPFKFMNVKVVGNDQAYIKNADAHLSLIDPTTLNLLTKANTKVDLFIDPLASVDKRATLKIDSPKFNLVHDGSIDLKLVDRRLLWQSNTKKDNQEYKFAADIATKGSLITFEKVTPERTSNVKYSRNGDKIEINLNTEFVEGKIEGDRKTGKISLKNKESNYELESNYKIENGRLVIESVSSNNAKLEAVLSRKEPSRFVLETPNTKANMDLDLLAPVKTFKFNFDNPRYQKTINAELEHLKHFKYSSYGKVKADNREHKVEINGVPLKALNVELDYPDFKFKVKQPQGSKKVEFSYTFNNYTENEEYDFDPNKAYFVNWASALRQYIQTFVVSS